MHRRIFAICLTAALAPAAALWPAASRAATGDDTGLSAADGRIRDAVRAAAAGGANASAPAIVGVVATPAAPAAAKPKPRKGGDLYYFTPEEAARAFERWGDREPSMNSEGFVFDSDVPPDIQQQMRDDLAFMGGIQGNGATPLHRQIFGQVDGPAYTRFFDSRVKAVGMNDCGNSNAVACVIPFEDPSKMWLTQNYIKFSHPQIARLMVVYHESRHTEGRHGYWGHATCPDPFLDADGNDMKSIWTGAPLAGEPACDETPLGSYGSSTILLKNIQKFCSNCTDKVKMDAGIYSDDQINRIINPDAKKQMQDDFAQ